MLIRYREPLVLTASLLVLLSLAASQSDTDNTVPNANREKASDPISNLFSEIGDFILDVDQTVAEQSRPKIEREAQIASQLFRPRTDYFDRIQKNYREMQKRIGRLIGDTIGFKNEYSDHELSTVSPHTESFVPTFKPDYNPFAAAAETRKEKLKQRIAKGSSDPQIFIPRTVDESLKTFGTLSKAITDDIVHFTRERPFKSHGKKISSPKRTGSLSFRQQCGNEVLEDPVLEQRRKDRCARIQQIRADLEKLLIKSKRASEDQFSKNPDTLDELTKDILARSGDIFIENEQVLDADEEIVNVETLDKTSSECSEEIFDDATLEDERKEKCLVEAEERLINDLNELLGKQSSESLASIDMKTIDDLSSVLIRRSGETEDEIPNIVSSDLSFDKQVRQLIKDHGSWILDYPLLRRWRQRDQSSDGIDSSSHPKSEQESTTVESTSDITEVEPTELYVPVSTDYEMALARSGEAENPHQSTYYKIVNEDGEVIEEEVDLVLDPESLSNDIEAIEIGRQEPKEIVILAFTADGVPLKLRLGPEIDNPFQYLHKALKSAGVSLNIPVESYDDLEPVGKEVLKLGSGVLTRAVLINVSNSNELKSLLKALMASKSSGKTTL